MSHSNKKRFVLFFLKLLKIASHTKFTTPLIYYYFHLCIKHNQFWCNIFVFSFYTFYLFCIFMFLKIWFLIFFPNFANRLENLWLWAIAMPMVNRWVEYIFNKQFFPTHILLYLLFSKLSNRFVAIFEKQIFSFVYF